MLPKSLFRHLGLTESETQRMPARVAALVEAEEERSERLIAWVQLALVGTFATLYFLTPRPVDAMDMMFEPVPIMLEIYLVFAVIRLVATYRGFLPGWLLVISMVADVALLYALIWTFHIAYDQPAAFYLKAPTFAYIFVFIAVRALRFDPRFVISQGVFAALGWIVMVVYAVRESGMDVITRSFTAYLTDNLVLIGAEFDKIFTVLLVTAILALALYRGRRTLMIAVTEGAASADMRRFFGRGVADAITQRDRSLMAGEATDRDAAILMLDLRGFSQFAATHPAHEVVDVLGRYHRLVLPIVERNGGVIDKFLGDGVMATFGAVRPSTTPAADAMRALDEVLAAGDAWLDGLTVDAALPINGAVSAGRVVAAALGNDDRLEFTVIGTAANLAAKLEKHNKVTHTRGLTTQNTYEQAQREGYAGACRPCGGQQVAGVAAPLQLVAIG